MPYLIISLIFTCCKIYIYIDYQFNFHLLIGEHFHLITHLAWVTCLSICMLITLSIHVDRSLGLTKLLFVYNLFFFFFFFFFFFVTGMISACIYFSYYVHSVHCNTSSVVIKCMSLSYFWLRYWNFITNNYQFNFKRTVHYLSD